jgi:hypothetical protein
MMNLVREFLIYETPHWRHVYYYIAPRWTNGVRGLVSPHVAVERMIEECRAWKDVLAGKRGYADQAMAKQRGVERIVVSFFYNTHFVYVSDLVGGRSWQVPIKDFTLDTWGARTDTDRYLICRGLSTTLDAHILSPTLTVPYMWYSFNHTPTSQESS